MAEIGNPDQGIPHEIQVSEPPPIPRPTIDELRVQAEGVREQEQGNAQLQRAIEELRMRQLVLREGVNSGAISEQEAREIALYLEAKERVEVEEDPLTGLIARGPAEEKMAQEISRANREGLPLSIAMMDLDKFKDINDTYGHKTGDVVLQAAAGHIKSDIRAIDIGLRYGGEEIGIILPNTSATNAAILLERIRQAMPDAVDEALNGQGINLARKVTVSVGIAELTREEIAALNREINEKQKNDPQVKGKVMREVFDKADKPLYEAKEGGRNLVKVRQPVVGKQ